MNQFPQQIGGRLNPTWVEMLMGFPRGWTSIDPISTLEFNKWIMGFGVANETKSRTKKILQGMWENFGKKALRKAIRGLSIIYEEKILFSELCKYEKNFNKAWLQLACPSSLEEKLRSVQLLQRITSASHRSKQGKQSDREYSDALQVLSQFLAQYGKAAWENNCWENAEPRTVVRLESRVDRIRAIGNGQVSCVAACAWNLLTEELYVNSR